MKTESERQEFVELSLWLANCQCKLIVPPEYSENYARYCELFLILHKP